MSQTDTQAEGLAKAFEPETIEQRWYAYWEEHRVFAPSIEEGDDRPTYVLPMPLPNIAMV